MSAESRSRALIANGSLTVLAVLAAAALTLAGCAAQEPGEPSPIGTGAPVIVPQGPGSPARTATPGERLGQTPGSPVAADVRFAEGMVPHHRQALEMSGLAGDRTENAAVRRFADRILTTQRPEITVMTSWLTGLGRAVPDTHAHDPSSGDGMASPAELNALRAARGAAFDRMFLELMIRHHEGALRMAGAELAGGRDLRMRLMAKDVYSGQSVEITRMRAALRSLP
ncbi:DUF305 domain-containing protein [Nonomuraea rhizosphaerae]|uniref:DUF305 domain-containing protein n=1 Tax=Nonomuraea rhizosphaerae TaxID=2665663 RepID=UPI001C5D59CC|nr:DUF305 domain-containing protein [Nonomuraea rhizosphaerae]